MTGWAIAKLAGAVLLAGASLYGMFVAGSDSARIYGHSSPLVQASVAFTCAALLLAFAA